MTLHPGNIWSGSPTLAAFTNPTERAYLKGNLKRRYPVRVGDSTYEDAELAYQRLKSKPGDTAVMVLILEEKLRQYPGLVDTITESGGSEWIEKCSHRIYGRNWWEGDGLDSPFIFCLWLAYREVAGLKNGRNGESK